jgi:Peptidase family M1 domain
VVVNFPSTIVSGTTLTMTIAYSGRLAPQVQEREALQVDQRGPSREDIPFVPPEPSFLYSNRSYWYPQSPISDYATARMRLTVPAGFACVASGEPVPGSPVSAGTGREVARRYEFVATQPVRYLATVISRFVRVDSSRLSLNPAPSSAPPSVRLHVSSEPGGGIQIGPPPRGLIGVSIQIAVEANPRQQGRGRELSQRAADVLRFYTAIIGDCPYPSFTLALVENTLPGGHSPAYFAALNQPLPTSPFSWRNDPASFSNYPDFFLAHELAHQWWGQAVGWTNFHEQWLSEGFAQYFSVLYAREQRGAEVFDGIIRQLRRWSLEHSDQGPVHLGYRLGHLKNDTRIFRALVYNKGAAVLHMLRRLIGDEAFFSGLRAFYKEHRFKKASTENVRAAFEEASGRNLEKFFEAWIYGSGVPRIRYSTRIEKDEAVLSFEHLDAILEVPVTVTIVYADGDQTDEIVPVAEQRVERRIPLAGPIREITVNRDDAAVAHFVR